MPLQPAIDYSPLDKMHHSGWHVFKNAFKGYIIAVFLIVTAISIGLVFTPADQLSIIVIILYGGLMTAKINSYKNEIWQEFATINGWATAKKISSPDFLPPSTNYGHSQSYGVVVKSRLGSINCDIYTYDTTTGEGKYQTTHYFTIACVPLPDKASHIILNSKKDKADIHTKFPNYEPLKLEGNFNDYFNLLLPKGQEIDVLALITPDVMQTLINSNSDEDIEINDQWLYFILRSDKRDTDSVKRLIESVEALSAQITQNITLSRPQQSVKNTVSAVNVSVAPKAV
jgi:flagellar biosynthesis protein FliQ